MRTSPAWLLLMALIAFGAGLFGTFILDDFAIFSDPILTSWSGWWEVWRFNQTRPLTYFTFWLNYQVGGSNPIGYHAVNLALHLCSVWLAFGALRRLMPEKIAWVATAIFAVHPTQSEAVNYVFARSTLLMAVFCLLSLREWLHERRWRAVLWFALALLAKEEAVAWPMFMVLLHWSRSRPEYEWKPISAMFGLSLLLGARVLLAADATPGSGAGTQAGISAWDYFWTQGLVIWSYAAMFVAPLWPYRLDSRVAPGIYWWAWVAVVAVVGLASRRMRGPRAGFWVVATLVLMLPSSSVFPAADLAADRRMYLAVLAGAVAIAMSSPRIEYALVVLVGLSVMRTWDWLDAERFWRKQASYGSARSMVQLARVVEPPEAVGLLERAKGNSPDDPLIASELGRAYLTSGAVDKALVEFGRGLALTPNHPQALSNRGVALLLLKQREAAQADFERALQLDPCSFEARLNGMRMGLQVGKAPQHCRYTDEERRALQGE
ncbi:MAG TPA: tetratricopeptide repeat protein [Bryobacteraceae bacterium]|nr:tetratricopeptide repeat protein [Bryobacteraceae bacterium]